MSERSRPNAPWAIRLIFWTMLVLLFVPILVMILGSFNDSGAITFKWYQDIFVDEELLSALQRSVILGLGSSLISTLIGLSTAIALFRSQFKFKNLLNSFSVLAMVLPELVFALSLLSWFFLIQLKLSLLTVLIAHVTFSLSFSIFLISSRLQQMDLSLDDAAKDLGASHWQILRTVTVPLLKSALIGSFILCFVLSFDDFLISYFVSGIGSDTLPIRLYTSMKAGHTPKLNALASLMMLPGLLAPLFVTKLLIKKNRRH